MIREIKPSDWKSFMAIRLEALQESPFAFGATFAEESKLSLLDWEKRTEQYCDDSNTCFLLSFVDANVIGMAGCYRNQEKEKRSHVYSVWLNPECRGSGISQQMISLLEEWSLANGMNIMEGYVAEINAAARAFYKKIGFLETDGQMAPSLEPITSDILIEKGLSNS